MTTQHTPGPWFTEALSTIGHCAIVDADGFTIANPSPMGMANARLIAAAPDLLAVLKEVADYWAGGDVPAELDARMRAAIAAATGEVCH